MKYKSYYFYGVIIFIFVVASFLILHHAERALNISLDSKINSFVTGGNFVEYDKQGNIKTKITADKIVEFQSEDRIVFHNPEIVTYSEKQVPWHIRADQAISNKKGDRVVLTGHVLIREMRNDNEPRSTIKTTELVIFPKQSLATTKEPVTLFRPGIIVNGVGLTANLKTGQYELKSQSEAIYQPSQKKI
ncbi:MAG: LPS export ABC transporter periplasmic protein LptC [Gammaproteobacteria bacterium RIFCSPLOWO2_02_FULL_42_14]|nr:MAG: LPS export ABC transporter periplasmic protein LptC [Gammaproteobacteria bacterium RIFCSPHIGHO2_02_FULL_42_43]OGT27240.1 MAG: LPS export ABC transporter periplasmic protein LptC [Gammaproteobacteria bacterium RIFCSPHIGHO2_01_FULL_42_8]OGT51886.1 MAG: LPS export ABC transporter periplasmic protein LptC [Gammaproteobacteria bacterium RIFCSPHIGHO2_12_FULL_41_25]OGT62400.1 MAG: LPS export ABC transporter periplasmic protein LptC [Gammaproteobacteria bacterium RIFCSPLOWO2_02_FULL_42_14]OGT85